MNKTHLGLIVALLVGCGEFDEHLPQVDIQGTLVLPRAAATRTVVNPTTGEPEEMTDARFIGPIYMGAFASVNEDDFPYPHPEIGPVIGSDQVEKIVAELALNDLDLHGVLIALSSPEVRVLWNMRSS